MNKVLIGIFGAALVVVGLISLQSASDVAKENKVGATIFPIYDIAQIIGGEEMEVVLMLPPGTSPHTFDPSPSLLNELQGSKAMLAIGLGLDSWVDGVADAIEAPVLTLEDGIALRETVDGHDDHDEEHEDEHAHDDHDDHGHDDHHGHNHGPTDPHYWLSVHNAEQIAMNIAHEFGELDEANAALYMERAESYAEELATLETELEEKADLLSGENIVSLHDAWYYFAAEYNVNIVGTFEPSAGKEPTPQYLVTLGDAVQDNGVTAIFLEPQLSSAGIEAFADDNNLSIAILDPIGGIDERDSYIELMRYNVDQLVGALTN